MYILFKTRWLTLREVEGALAALAKDSLTPAQFFESIACTPTDTADDRQTHCTKREADPVDHFYEACGRAVDPSSLRSVYWIVSVQRTSILSF
jgi:hypothetical protein